MQIWQPYLPAEKLHDPELVKYRIRNVSTLALPKSDLLLVV